MRIAMVSEHASPLAVLGGQDAGGQNVHVAQLSTALAARGHEVTVYTRRDAAHLPGRQPFAPGVEVVHVPAGPPRAVAKDELLPWMPDLAAWLATEWAAAPPDVVHAHFWMSALATRDAVRRLPSAVPAAVTFHALGVVKQRHQGADDTSPPGRLAIESRLVHDLDAVVATCRDEVRELLALGAPPEALHVVPCGVDLERFTPQGDHLVPWRQGAARLLCLGRLVERKGVETAIDALAGLPDAELVVAGGPAGDALADDADVRRLQAHALRSGVAQRVRFVGRVGADGAAALLRAADVLVAVPWYEPFGIVPLEAMACGTPVVASAVGGMLDTVEDGGTGVHVPPRDPDAVARAVRDLLASPQRRRRAGAAGVERMRAGYGWAAVAAQTEAVYDALVARVPQPRHLLVPVRVPDQPRATSAPPTEPDRHPRDPGGDPVSRPRGIPYTTLHEHLEDLAVGLASLAGQSDEIDEWGRALAGCLDGGRLLVAGNGGSAAEAQHLTAELVGRFEAERRPLSALVLHGDASTVTAVTNDYGGEEVFARQVQAHGRPGDVLLLLTTSGRSANLLRAAERARDCGVAVWAMTGPAPNPLSRMADRLIAVDARSVSSIQEAHLVAVHALCAAVERSLVTADLDLTGEAPAVVDVRS
jgi:type III pantothenate kinase